MSKKFDIAVKTGSYEKDGETKNRYENVGVIMQGENGPYIIMKRTFNPAGVPNEENRPSVILSLFKPKEEKEQNSNNTDGWDE